VTRRSRLRRWAAAVLRYLWDGLVAYGKSVLGAHVPLTDPPPGHPERWHPDQPLTETELALARQLAGRRRRARPPR
jgi:Family of unknown function (DUF6059)